MRKTFVYLFPPWLGNLALTTGCTGTSYSCQCDVYHLVFAVWHEEPNSQRGSIPNLLHDSCINLHKHSHRPARIPSDRQSKFPSIQKRKPGNLPALCDARRGPATKLSRESSEDRRDKPVCQSCSRSPAIQPWLRAQALSF